MRRVDIVTGTVDVKNMTMAIRGYSSVAIRVQRTQDNKKIRPNGKRRHNPYELQEDETENPFDFTHSTDLEWLSLNWRKYRAS